MRQSAYFSDCHTSTAQSAAGGRVSARVYGRWITADDSHASRSADDPSIHAEPCRAGPTSSDGHTSSAVAPPRASSHCHGNVPGSVQVRARAARTHVAQRRQPRFPRRWRSGRRRNQGMQIARDDVRTGVYRATQCRRPLSRITTVKDASNDD